MTDTDRQTRQLVGRLDTISGKIKVLADTVDPHVIVTVMGPELAAEVMNLSFRIDQVVEKHSRAERGEGR